MGFGCRIDDLPNSSEFRAKMPDSLQYCRLVSELMLEWAGRQFWKEHGVGFPGFKC
jgi:hypothetical protein